MACFASSGANFIRGQASFSMEGGYDHPQPGAALMQRLGFTAGFSNDLNLPWVHVGLRYMFRDMPDGSMQPSILYNGFLGQVGLDTIDVEIWASQ